MNIYCLIDKKSNIIYLDNDKYESLYLSNIEEHDYKKEQIFINEEFNEKYLLDDLKFLDNTEIISYIKFWNYMNSNKYVFNGIFELYIVRKQRNNIHDYIDNIDNIYDDIDNFLDYLLTHTLEESIKIKKYQDFFKILVDKQYKLMFPYTQIFAKYDNFDLFKYAISKNYKPDIYSLNYCTRNGNLEMMEYINKNFDIKMEKMTFFEAMLSNNLECVKYCHNNNCPYDKSRLLDYCYSQKIKKYILENM
jgi:hypothetical protein